MEKPFLTFVGTARNDDYGGKLIERTYTSISVLKDLAEAHKLPLEYILVDYNPVEGKKYLAEELGIKNSPYFKLRSIIVPREFHSKFPTKIPLLEYISKNIGVRRAQGEYVIATNPDVIFSEEFILYCKNGKLDKNSFYCANRHDLTIDSFPKEMNTKAILNICKRRVGKIMYTPRTHYVSFWVWFDRMIHGRTMRDFSYFPLFNRLYPIDNSLVHENAAGDFAMAHRDVWNNVRGYGEPPHNLHHDSILLFMLEALGYKQVVLSEPIYHINHKIGRAGRPGLKYIEFRELTKKIQETKNSNITNDENWGFAKENFKEI